MKKRLSEYLTIPKAVSVIIVTFLLATFVVQSASAYYHERGIIAQKYDGWICHGGDLFYAQLSADFTSWYDLLITTKLTQSEWFTVGDGGYGFLMCYGAGSAQVVFPTYVTISYLSIQRVGGVGVYTYTGGVGYHYITIVMSSWALASTWIIYIKTTNIPSAYWGRQEIIAFSVACGSEFKQRFVYLQI